VRNASFRTRAGAVDAEPDLGDSHFGTFRTMFVISDSAGALTRPIREDPMRRPSRRPGKRLPRWSALLVALALAATGLAGLTRPAARAAEAGLGPGSEVAGIGHPSRAPAQRAAATHTVGFDHYSLTIDGRRLYLWSAEFHYWRLPSPDLWRDVLEKLKAAGYNATSIYFDWGYHSPAPGVYDFSGVRDIERLLNIAEDVGIYVIARPGPYINAETDSGGFPGWLVTQKGRARSSAPDFTAAYRDWLRHVDQIIARHQITDGGGSVILYQIENEYGNNTDAQYMQDQQAQVRADGIDVPLTHNHCCGPSTWATGPGAVDIPGRDNYPQGFNCSTPDRWNGVSTLPRFRDDSPIFTPEFQGGSFDPWGGPGYDNCRTLTGPDFEKVFYKNNIASGATMQNFYMTYGGTSWGWLADPGLVYTSYDYGAAIKEDRELTAKYDETKRLGHLTQAFKPLTKTDPIASQAPTNPAVQVDGRANPDDNTHLYVVRHRDSTATTTDRTHIAVDLSAKATYTHDDADGALSYEGSGWSHAANQPFTSGDYKNTESFSSQAGDSVTATFTGTAVRWISSYDGNHGIADVFLDGTKVATVDGYGASKQFQQVFYAADGLADTTHTLRIVATGARNAAASGAFVVVDAIDVPTGAGVGDAYPSVPQQPGTDITLAGRDSKLLIAGYDMDSQRLQYSTSELMTHGHIGGRDVALLYGRSGQDGETVLRYGAEPTVTVLSGDVSHTWDADRKDLRLNYSHDGLARVLVTPAGAAGSSTDATPLLLLIGTDEVAAQFWRQDTTAGPVLVRGPKLVRSASYGSGSRSGSGPGSGVLALRGDTAAPTDIEIHAAPAVRTITWNGANVATRRRGDDGALTGRLAGPRPVTLPALTDWRLQRESPEAQPGFDDGRWRLADKATTNNPTQPAAPPVLYTDEYGFHHGDVWYRGHFTAHGAETGVSLSAITGRAGTYSAWLNGTFLGSSGDRTHRFEFPAGSLRSGRDNVLAVLVENMGHNGDFNADDTHKEPRGLTGATILGSTAQLSWRIQGSLGGEDLVDPARGPMNVGGLFGERGGWHLPGFPDAGWDGVTLPHPDTRPGISWYRTTFDLDLPQGQDVPMGIKITDDPTRRYRALLFVNGWQIGRYINHVGPQRTFPVPPGILRTNGTNTLAIAVWSEDGSTGGLGAVALDQYANLATSLKVSNVPSPAYDPRVYRPPAPSTAALSVTAPDVIERGGAGTVTATFTDPADRPLARDVTVRLRVPDGWTATPAGAARLGTVRPGTSAAATWKVTGPAGEQPGAAVFSATASYRQEDRIDAADGAAVVRVPPPPPTGSAFVSDIPFTSTNGWGPVERDTSNGENAAGDGRTITLNGTTFTKGLGVHAVGDVSIFLGGNCSRFTAVAGVDDEVGSAGSVTFSVVADGATLMTTPTLTGGSASANVDVDVSGAQQLDLIIGDGGDGNGTDHGDWADARLTCAPPEGT
jgi:beta-galactosidase GanA